MLRMNKLSIEKRKQEKLKDIEEDKKLAEYNKRKIIEEEKKKMNLKKMSKNMNHG